MSESATNAIWKKAELAMVAYIAAQSIGVNGANVYPSHRNEQKKTPWIECECHEGEVESRGRATGNWLTKCTIRIATVLGNETGEDASGRFASIMDAFSTDDAPVNLSSETIIFTCFLCQITGFTKRTIGDELITEINLELTCCGSVIT